MPNQQVSEGLVATQRLAVHVLRSSPERPEGKVLLLGGSNFDLRLKRQFLETELANRFDILTYEPRGIGRTEHPDGNWQMVDYARDAIAVMDAVGWESAEVLGESFGGMTALHLAHHAPHRVSRLALAATTAGGIGGSSVDISRLLDLPKREAATEALKLLDTENATLEAEDPVAFEARLAARMDFDAIFADPSVANGGYPRLLKARKAHDIWDRLQNIAHETVVITGKRDAQAPPRAQTAMAKRLPNAVQWVYDAGHGVAFAGSQPMQELCAEWSAHLKRDVGT